MLRHDTVERLHVLERTPHHQRVVHALAVVGEHPHPRGRLGHRAELGELLPTQADRDGADGVDITVTGVLTEPPDLLDDTGDVGNRLGVGHRVHGGEATERGCERAGLDRLGVLAAGLAQVGVQVDETGQRDQPAGVEHLRAGRRVIDEHAVVDVQVGGIAAQRAHTTENPPRAHAAPALSSLSVSRAPPSRR